MADGNAPKHPLGRRLASIEDALGRIEVRELALHRFLTFGNAVEQSCCDTRWPWRLEHAYGQAMMLGLLLHPGPSSVLLAGLGGGSLAQALRRQDPKLSITALELRQAVIDLAREWFALPGDDPRLKVVCADAGSHLARDSTRYDLIFADLYLADGAHPVQNDRQFLRICHRHLRHQGILVSNAWCNDYTDIVHHRAALEAEFGDRILSLYVSGGNLILFAFPDRIPRLRREDFLAQARDLGTRLDIPFQRLAKDFWQQNSESLNRALRVAPGIPDIRP